MNSDTKENYGQDDQNIQNADKGTKGQQKNSSLSSHPITDNAEPDYADDLSNEENSSESDTKTHTGQNQQKSKISSSVPHSNPYDSENLDNESDSETKDITEQDIEEDLIENDPSEGFETDIDIQKRDESETDSFETIEPNQDNPVSREFEIGQLGKKELREDELSRDESANGAPGHDKPSQRKF